MWAIIGTWKMSLDGIKVASKILEKGGEVDDAVENAIKVVEDEPSYNSVGYGGLPNEYGEVELDAAFMRGNDYSFGAVGGIKDFKNPISIARRLSNERFNIFLIGNGAEEYAHKNGFERRNMLIIDSKEVWNKKLREINEQPLIPYGGHDTVGVVGIDKHGNMAAGTSTSGLFMKKRGRIGDSPICGSGLYVDSEIGGAVATGLGEDIMKGCLSYEVVRRMANGYSPQQAAEETVFEFAEKLKKRSGNVGAVSIACLNNKGEWGVGTNVEFSFVVATSIIGIKVFIAKPINNFKLEIEEIEES